MFGLIKKLLKMITNKKFLLVAAIAAVAAGAFFYYKSNIAGKQQVDEEPKTETNDMEAIINNLTPEVVAEETQDLGQAAQSEPEAADAVVENFAML